MQWDYLLNYPLERAKNKGMPNPKNMPFLMCPTRRTGALGGTPLTRSEAGGHIKKGAWVNAHDAALVALAHLLVSSSNPGAAREPARQNEEDDPDGEEGVGHGSLRKVFDQHVDDHVEQYAYAGAYKEEGGEVGHSGLGFLLASLGRNQLRPDAGVGLLAQHLPCQLALRIDLSTTRALWVHVSAPGQALIEVLLVDARQSGEALAVVGCQLVSHGTHHIDSLDHVKRFARLAV